MLYYAAVVLVLAALGGAVLATVRFSQHHNPPTWLAIGHGLAAVTGVVLLSLAIDWEAISVPLIFALVAFASAAAIGLFMFFTFHQNKNKIPGAAVVAHITAAVMGMVLLVGMLMAR